MVMCLVAAVAWIVTIVVVIATGQPDGEPTAEQLAGTLQAAVAAGEPDGVRRLLADPPGGDQAVHALLRDLDCGGATTIAVARQGARPLLAVSGATGLCGHLAISQHDGRWLVDPWAAPLR